MPGQRAAEAVRREQILKAAYEVASRKGLARLTVRQVAARARLSAGLVLFHFKSKDQLVVALLDWLLATTTVLHIGPDIQRIGPPLDRLLALLRQEMDRLASEPRRIRLFFEYWVLGGRHAEIGGKMRAELARYREAFRPMVQQVLVAEPDRFAHVTADGLAAVAVSFIKGCAVQSMIDPARFNIRHYLAAAEALLGQFMASPGSLTA
ncbi:MAG TPA: TetR family transcriptional regulator [Gemmatimonadales bacterium]|nr:TetR family transcriptional regulator [Gemmatimonadales bacterium]